MKRFAGKVVLVTGAGGALGRASAVRFVEEGARVIIADADHERATAVADEIGLDAIAFGADVTIARGLRGDGAGRAGHFRQAGCGFR